MYLTAVFPINNVTNSWCSIPLASSFIPISFIPMVKSTYNTIIIHYTHDDVFCFLRHY